MKRLISVPVLTKLALVSVALTVSAIVAPAHAMYHGSSDCQYKDKDVEVTMSQREGAEGLGFDGVKIRDRKTGKSTIYPNTSDNFYGDLNVGELIKFKDKDQDATFEVVSIKVTKDDSSEGECSIHDDLTATVVMKLHLPFKPKVMTFTCHKEGFNPQMDITCGADRE